MVTVWLLQKRSLWFSPGEIAMEGRSSGVQVQIEKIDIVVFSLNNGRREILLSDRPVLGSFRCVREASQRLADSNAKLIF